MKRFLAPILLLTLLFPSLALGETMKDLVVREGIHYKKFSDIPFTGKTTGENQGSLKNGKRVGPWVEYYSNGQLLFKGTYKNGEKYGSWIKYYDNGQLENKGTYRDGKKDGSWVDYHKNGQLWSKGTFKDGKSHGPWVSYHENGQFESRVTFLNGKRVQPSQYVKYEVLHQIRPCWIILAGIKDRKYRQVRIKIKLTRIGELKQKPELINKSLYENDVYYRVQAESAIRSLENPKCTPFKLPLSFYELWKDIILTFDARDLL